MTYLSTAEVAEIKGCTPRYVRQLAQKGKQDIASARLNPGNWLVCKDTPAELVIEHKVSGKVRIIRKDMLR